MGKMQDYQDQYYLNLDDATIEKMIQENPENRFLYEKREEVRQRVLGNVIHLERLDPFKAIPRDKGSVFVKKGAKTDKKTAMTAPLVYGSIVQASNFLYQPLPPWEVIKNANGGMVVLFTLDPRHQYDKQWLLDMANRVAALKSAPSVPDDMRGLVKNLLDTRSIFCSRVGASLTGDVEAWCCTVFVDGLKDLPKRFLPNEKILPFLVVKESLEDKTYVYESAGKTLGLIDRDFYM